MPSHKEWWRRLARTSGFRPWFLSALVLVTAVACSNGSEPEPTATLVGTGPTATATDADQALTVKELLESIERGVEELRGIETPLPVDHRFVDQAGMRERLAEELNDPEVLEQIEHEEALFKLLGVIPQDADLNAIYESLFGSQVLGLYDPEKEEFFVLGDDQSGAESLDIEAQLTYAHEYVHRLQDARFDLEAIEERAGNDDMSLAIAALIEGDATSAQSQYMLANYDFLELSELLESALAAQADLEDAPYFLQKSLEFPYTDGAAFVAILLQLGQFAAVNAVFDDPPKSTEQVLHPEKYFDGEMPIELDIPDDAMGAGWSIQGENVLGEFFIRTWLEALGSDDATAAAAGWGGDVYALVDVGSDEVGFVSTIGWDSSEDAKEFFEAMTSAMDENEEYSPLGTGIPGVLESWNSPAGAMVISRWVSDSITDRIAIGISSSVEISQSLQMLGAYEFSDVIDLPVE